MEGSRGEPLLIVRPHAKHFNRLLILHNLVYEAMLDTDPAGYRAFQITDEAFEPWWTPIGIRFNYGEQLLRPSLQPRGR